MSSKAEAGMETSRRWGGAPGAKGEPEKPRKLKEEHEASDHRGPRPGRYQGNAAHMCTFSVGVGVGRQDGRTAGRHQIPGEALFLPKAPTQRAAGPALPWALSVPGSQKPGVHTAP